MQRIMKKTLCFCIAMSLAIIGTLLFVAGPNRLGVLSENLAFLLGMGAYMFSGLFWILFAQAARRKQQWRNVRQRRAREKRSGMRFRR